MKKAREYTKIIVTRLNDTLKTRFDQYCGKLGVGGSEVIRCFILGLPNVGEPVDARSDLVAMRDLLQTRIDELDKQP